MKKTLLIATTAAVLSACSSVPNTQLHSAQHYQVEWIGERPLIDSSMLTLSLIDKTQAAGMAGCNNWTA